MKVVTGDLVVTAAGTVIENLDVRGIIKVKADNVTIRNSMVRGGSAATETSALIESWWGASNLKIENSTLTPTASSIYMDGVSGSDYVADGVDVYGVVDGFKVNNGSAVILNSWMHSAYYSDDDPTHSDGHTHNDGIQVAQLTGTSNLQVAGNLIEGFPNAALMISQNSAAASNQISLESNRLGGGSCQINYVDQADGSGAVADSFQLVDNDFRPGTYGSTCPVRVPSSVAKMLTLSGNYWGTTGKSITSASLNWY